MLIRLRMQAYYSHQEYNTLGSLITVISKHLGSTGNLQIIYKWHLHMQTWLGMSEGKDSF